MKNDFELNDRELEQISGGPEERTVLGLKNASECRKCENCGKIFEDNTLLYCDVCGTKISD